MWSSGKDTNENGESVLLLLPSFDKRRGKRASTASSSHVGGIARYHDDENQFFKDIGLESSNPKCTKCKTQMYLLLQLHAPLDDLDRTLYLFGCNNPSCHVLLDDYSTSPGVRDDTVIRIRFGANIGGKLGGSVRCFRSQQQHLSDGPKDLASDEKPSKTQVQKSLTDNDWGMDDDSGGWGDVDDVDGWDQSSYVAVQTTTSMDDLETSLKGCELQSNQEKLSGLNAKINQHSNEKHNNNNISAPSFVHYELEMINEPVGKTQNDCSDEEDGDDELGASYNIDASKVDSMLSRYLDMEEDKEIIAALKGGKNVSANICGGESGGGERYERLKPEEKAFLTFSKRLRRAPTQVCRYAYGGEPLWSIPLPPKTNFNGGSKQQKPKKNTITTAPFPIIPPCSCGSERVFEFQLLPSLLHTLDVDAANSNKDDEIDKTDLTLMGGMNWGSIAVYSCPESCDESREEFLIVQESGEDVMTKQVSEKMSEDEDCNGA